METLFFIVFALQGIAFGSFLNVCIDRLPAGSSLISPPSHCDACQQRLSPKDLIPLVSYLWLRGRCRYCRAKIPARLFWVEVGTGLLFALAFWRFGLSAEFAVAAFYSALFLMIGVIDLEHKLILNKVVYLAAFVALLISLLLHQPKVVDALIGGAIGFAFLLIPVLVTPLLIKREGMGWGDVKMAALIGLVTGFPMVLVAMLMGVVLGGAVAIILLLLRIKKRKETIPFGPFLSIATIATLLWGSHILDWYLGFFP